MVAVFMAYMKRFVLLDRDGTIIVDRVYLADPAGVELLPNAVAGLRRLRELGFGLVLVTNQSGIGRGFFDEATLRRIHDRLVDTLAAEGIALDGIYFCPHVDDDDCGCRKPRPGMAEQALREHGFDAAQSFVIGDRDPDIGLARAIGARSILVRTGGGLETEREKKCVPDYTADDLLAAADWIAQRIGP
jgi:D-glycero-D-manno-heptose 1,7-bisphosphate phosphatase